MTVDVERNFRITGMIHQSFSNSNSLFYLLEQMNGYLKRLFGPKWIEEFNEETRKKSRRCLKSSQSMKTAIDIFQFVD